MKSNLDSQSFIAQWITSLFLNHKYILSFQPCQWKKSSRIKPLTQRPEEHNTLDVRKREAEDWQHLMTETPIYFLCPIHFPPILYIPLISLSQQHLMLGFTYQQEQRMTFSKLLKFNTAHIVSFVNWSWPSEALNHCFLFGQLLSLVFSENLQPFMLSSHWIFPMVS